MPPKLAGERYSLWFMPTGGVYESLARTIRRLSARYGGPEFLPHLTLLGGFVSLRRDALRRCAALAHMLRPFTIYMGKVGFRDEYFRCLFVHAEMTPALRKANLVAHRVFGRDLDRPFMPHLSLLYGNFPRGLKEEISAELGSRLDLQFKVRRVFLYRTQESPLQWRRMATFGLE